MNTNTLKVGIIGTGSIADSSHAPAIGSVDGLTLTAVLSRTTEKGEAFLRKHGSSGNTHTSIEEFLSDNINLVIICSPDQLHFKQAKACLEAGKHVLLEKPMTMNVDEAKELTKIADEKGLSLMTGFHLRHHNGHIKLKSAIESGELGELQHIRVIWAFPMADDSNWRAKEELTKWWSLSAVGSHCLDTARWLADDMDEWKQFNATLSNDAWKGPHDETAVIAAQLKSGPTVEIVSSVLFGPYTKIEVFGGKGQAICTDTLSRNGAGSISINGNNISFEVEPPFVNQLKRMKLNIESGKTSSMPGAVSVADLNLAIS